MNDKKQLLGMLKEVFYRWEALLAGMSEEQITDPQLPGDWSIKDVIAHLWAWQQRSVARNEAALHGGGPDYPRWSVPGSDAAADQSRFDYPPEEYVGQVNAWIYETNRDRPWPAVYADWRAQFLRFVETTEEIPESDLLTPGRYAWTNGYPLSASLLGSHEHHQEHLEELLAWLGRYGGAQAT